MTAARERALQLQAEIDAYAAEQAQLLGSLRGALADATQGRAATVSAPVDGSAVQQQISELTVLSSTREYVVRLKAAAEEVKQLERQIRGAAAAAEPQHAAQLAQQAKDAADAYARCRAGLGAIGGAGFGADAVPEQLRTLERQLTERLQAAQELLHSALSSQIQGFLAQCGWPPPLVPRAAGEQGGASGPMFGQAQHEALNLLQLLMVSLTRLQLAAQHDDMQAVLQAVAAGGAPAGQDAPLLWVASELAAPLCQQLLQVFGPSGRGSPGALDNPDLVLGTVHRLALENVGRIDWAQAVIQATELHGAYHIGVEFTRALREAVKQLLRAHKLPEVAAAANRELWLAWIDALIAFEGSLGRSGLLGCYWDVADAGDLPALLLRGSTLSVLGEDAAWMDAWLDAESGAAVKQVEGILFSERGWGPGQQLVLEEGRDAWEADLWPPRAAEEVVALVESQLSRLRFIPQPAAQERYLAGAVSSVLQQALERISRMLQQAELFKNIASYAWLPRVCMCICFCHYVEQQLQDMHDDAQVMVTRLLEEQQQLLNNANSSSHTPNGWAQPSGQQQPQQPQQQAWMPAPTSNGSGAHAPDGWQQQQPGASQQHPDVQQLSQAAAAKLRLLSRPITEFSSCRQEWVLKLGKAAAMGFMQHASGYVSRGALFKVSSESLPALAAGGALWSSGVVSGELQPALAWLSSLLEALSHHLDKECFRQAWGAAAAAINRELFNNVACEAIFSDAGALQLAVDQAALLRLFGRFTPRPACHFRELGDAVKLLNLQQAQAEFVRQAVSAATRAPNAAELLKSVGVYHLEPDLADTVLSLRMYK